MVVELKRGGAGGEAADEPRLRPREGAYLGPESDGPSRLAWDEWIVVLVIGFAMILTAWSFGGVEADTRKWQIGSGGLALGVTLLVRIFGGQDTLGGILRHLLFFPPFWFGIFLFGYAYLQAINPEFKLVQGLVRERPVWWLTNEGLLPRDGWPTSIQAPDDFGNPFSFIERYLAAWLLVLAIWIGVRRRKVVALILVLFLSNGLVYSVVTLLQEIDGTNKLLWTRYWSGRDFSGSFYYRNHGGAFLYLNLGVTLAVFFLRHRELGLRWMGDFGFRIFLVFSGSLAAVAAVSSMSRASWMGAGVLFAIFFGFNFINLFRKRVEHRWLNFGLIALVPLAIGGIAVLSLQQGRVKERWIDLVNIREESSAVARIIGDRYSWYLHEQRPTFGFGADSYRHLSALHQDKLKELNLGFNRHRRGDTYLVTHMVAAHNDPLQWLVELGKVGILPLLGIIGFWLVVYTWHLRKFQLVDWMLLATICCLVVHSFWELLFLSGSILVATSGLIALLGSSLLAGANPERGLELKDAKSSRKSSKKNEHSLEKKKSVSQHRAV
ncbi:MAG: O-antigen ligase family protein [Puniceicoccaceae bacterium]